MQEEYDGDYTRLLDYCRGTILCDSLEDLEKVLQFMFPANSNHDLILCFHLPNPIFHLQVLQFILSEDRAPRFVTVRSTAISANSL